MNEYIFNPEEYGEAPQQSRNYIYASYKMHRIKEVIDQVAGTNVTILIQGESGVGKEVVARSIYLNSSRKTKPFIKVNCAALPQGLLESELFGYEKGAFTGAYRQKPGKFELADGGTVFLDEISEITPPSQAKLLQVLQDGEFSRLGGKKDVRVDVRILVATNKNIEKEVQNGSFRKDLYYRLNVVNIAIPPLRERKEEIPVFVQYFLDKFQRKYNSRVNSVPDRMMRALLQHQWLGNIRELENVIQRFVLLGNEEAIIDDLLPPDKKDCLETLEAPLHNHDQVSLSLKEICAEAAVKAESEVIKKTLQITNWNRKRAASMLDISYKALLYKIKTQRIG